MTYTDVCNFAKLVTKGREGTTLHIALRAGGYKLVAASDYARRFDLIDLLVNQASSQNSTPSVLPTAGAPVPDYSTVDPTPTTSYGSDTSSSQQSDPSPMLTAQARQMASRQLSATARKRDTFSRHHTLLKRRYIHSPPEEHALAPQGSWGNVFEDLGVNTPPKTPTTETPRLLRVDDGGSGQTTVASEGGTPPSYATPPPGSWKRKAGPLSREPGHDPSINQLVMRRIRRAGGVLERAISGLNASLRAGVADALYEVRVDACNADLDIDDALGIQNRLGKLERDCARFLGVQASGIMIDVDTFVAAGKQEDEALEVLSGTTEKARSVPTKLILPRAWKGTNDVMMELLGTIEEPGAIKSAQKKAEFKETLEKMVGDAAKDDRHRAPFDNEWYYRRARDLLDAVEAAQVYDQRKTTLPYGQRKVLESKEVWKEYGGVLMPTIIQYARQGLGSILNKLLRCVMGWLGLLGWLGWFGWR